MMGKVYYCTHTHTHIHSLTHYSHKDWAGLFQRNATCIATLHMPRLVQINHATPWSRSQMGRLPEAF